MGTPQIFGASPCTSQGSEHLAGACQFAARLEREIAVRALSRLTHCRVSELLAYISANKHYSGALARLRVCELIASPDSIDLGRLRSAQRAQGEDYDALVLGVLRQAYPTWVDATYLRARLGGPRWKLQKSLARLVREELVLRSGRTSDTRYVALRESS